MSQCAICNGLLPPPGRNGRPRRYCDKCNCDHGKVNVICPQCGNSFMATSFSGRFRCPQCRLTPRRQTIHQNRCAGCGREWCSRRQLNRCRSCSQRKYPERFFICKGCGKNVKQERQDCNTFCSRECAFDFSKRQAHERAEAKKANYCAPPPRAFTCVVCSGRFLSWAYSRVCSDECKRSRAADYMRVRYLTKAGRRYPKCKVCGQIFEKRPGLGQGWCSAACRKVIAETNHRQNRIRRHTKERSIKSEVYSRESIFLRDNWTCHICGQKIDHRLPPYHKYAATIDHVIPVSRGGSDTKDNVKAAHRWCNSFKCDAALEEIKDTVASLFLAV